MSAAGSEPACCFVFDDGGSAPPCDDGIEGNEKETLDDIDVEEYVRPTSPAAVPRRPRKTSRVDVPEAAPTPATAIDDGAIAEVPRVPAVRRGPETDAERFTFDILVKNGLREDTTLYWWQWEAVARIFKRFNVLLAQDPGLGKTVEAACGIAYARYIATMEGGPPPLSVVVCPTSLQMHWCESIQRFLPNLKIFMWREENALARQKAYSSDADVLIITHRSLVDEFLRVYENVQRDDDDDADEDLVCTRWLPKKDAPRSALMEYAKLGAFVLDEGHAFRNPKTAGFAAAVVASKEADVRIVCTGTPYHNSTQDMTSLFKLVKAEDDVCDDKTYAKNGKALTDVIDGLHASIMVVHTKDVLGLPPPVVHTHVLALDAEADRLARDVCRTAMARLRMFKRKQEGRSFASLWTLVTAVRQLSVSPHLVNLKILRDETLDESDDESDDDEPKSTLEMHAATARRIAADPSPKLVAVADAIAACAAQNRKCAVFGCFVAPLIALQMLCKSRLPASKRTALVCNHVTGTAREGVLKDICDDDGCVALIATYKTGGEGLNLAPAVTSVFLMEVPWTHAVVKQAIDRVHRIGADVDTPVEVRHFKYEASFDIVGDEMYVQKKKRSAEVFTHGARCANAGDARLDVKEVERLFHTLIRKLGKNPGSDVTLAEELGIDAQPKKRRAEQTQPNEKRAAVRRGDLASFAEAR